MVNTLEIEDLKIDLADKKEFQLINNANEAKYYYDQAKS